MAPTYEWMEAHGVEFGRCCAINGEPFAGLSSVASVHGRDTAKAFTEVFEGCCLDAGVEFMFDTEANGLLLGEDGAGSRRDGDGLGRACAGDSCEVGRVGHGRVRRRRRTLRR